MGSWLLVCVGMGGHKAVKTCPSQNYVLESVARAYRVCMMLLSSFTTDPEMAAPRLRPRYTHACNACSLHDFLLCPVHLHNVPADGQHTL
jgi:hypothetical protein